MPPGRKRPIEPSALSIQASAKIGASAKYEVHKTVSERIPEDVTRAKHDAWLTILSPITQWAGLIGDKLAHKRDLLRIQQEETLTAIMLRAAPRLALLRPPIKPVPVKFLVPFLEYASLEEPDSELVKMWANLLVSSAENYHPDNVYYVRLISQMSSVQARLFEAMIGPRGPQSVLVSMEENFFLGQNFLADRIRDAFGNAKKPPSTLRQAWNRLTKTLRRRDRDPRLSHIHGKRRQHRLAQQRQRSLVQQRGPRGGDDRRVHHPAGPVDGEPHRHATFLAAAPCLLRIGLPGGEPSEH